MRESGKLIAFLLVCVLLMGQDIAMSTAALTAATIYMRSKMDAVLAEDEEALRGCGQAGDDARRYCRRLYNWIFALLCFVAVTSWMLTFARAWDA